jgi:hypothetical protein
LARQNLSQRDICVNALATGRHCQPLALRRSAARLGGHLRADGLVVGLEPSCTAVFCSDASELLHGDADVRRLAEQTLALAELLASPGCGGSCPVAPPGVTRRAPQAGQEGQSNRS